MLTDEQSTAVDRFLGAVAPDEATLAKAILTAGEQSSGDPAAMSPTGARGLMQLTPIALRDLGRDPVTFNYDSPSESLRAGVEYLQLLKGKYGLTNPLQIAAAYNAGPGTVQAAVKAGSLATLPAETQDYVRRMQSALSATPIPSVVPAPETPETMDHPTRHELRAGRGPVDIPDATALTLSNMAQQREALPWYQALPQRAIEPLAELGIQGARAATGSTLPPLPIDRLATDVVQTVGLLPIPVGRLATAAIQGGAGLAAGLQAAAERHATSGGSWADQVSKMDTTDALVIGGSAILGAGTGAAFPGKAAKPFSPEGGIAQARQDLGDLMARTQAEQLLPAPRSGEVTAAFGKLDRQAPIDATGWRNAVLQHSQIEGASIPNEVQAVVKRLVPETRQEVRPGSLAGHSFLPATLPVDVIDVPTGRWFTAPVQPNPTGAGLIGGLGDLLDANMRLGHMVNTAEARTASAALGHSTGNLNALRGALTDQIMEALPASQRPLYAAARETSREVAQSNAGMRFLERFVNPDQRILNGAGLYKSLTEGGGGTSRRELLQRRFGAENYRQLVDFATSVRAIVSTPAKVPVLQQVLSLSAQAGFGGAAYHFGGTPALGAVLTGRVLYGLATSRVGLRAFDAMARSPVGAKTFVQATGRLALAHALLAKELATQMPSPDPSVEGLLNPGARP